MATNIIPQHEPLRCPRHWEGGSQKDFVVQLERILTDIYRNIGLLRRENEMTSTRKVQTGTFVADGSNAIKIPCPFEPDVIAVWCDDLKTNPGISTGGLASCFIVKGFGFNTIRYNSATSGQVVGGAIRNPVISYSSGVYTFYSQSDLEQFYPVEGYTYNYCLAKQ